MTRTCCQLLPRAGGLNYSCETKGARVAVAPPCRGIECCATLMAVGLVVAPPCRGIELFFDPKRSFEEGCSPVQGD